MKSYIVVGLGYGDEGKGTTVDYITRERKASLVVRYNGGCQAGHNVVIPGGLHHTFSQLSSGTLAKARTFLSKHMMVEPLALAREANAIAFKVSNPLGLVHIDEQALVTTPFHIATNRIRERARGANRHGSCGMGVGETRKDALEQPADLVLTMSDLLNNETLKVKLERIMEMKKAQLEAEKLFDTDDFEAAYFNRSTIEKLISKYASVVRQVRVVGSKWFEAESKKDQVIVFEGAQGILLDEIAGFHPHTTWSRTTSENAYSLLKEVNYAGDIDCLGITRAYSTRHGTGPFVTVDPAFDKISEGDHNCTNEWQMNFKSGPMDLIALQYALQADPNISRVVITHLDKLKLMGGKFKFCTGYKVASGTERDLFLPVKSKEAGTSMQAPPEKEDLKRQERLGSALYAAEPVYEELDFDPSDMDKLLLARKVAERLSRPLAAISKGNTFQEKVNYSI